MKAAQFQEAVGECGVGGPVLTEADKILQGEESTRLEERPNDSTDTERGC